MLPLTPATTAGAGSAAEAGRQANQWLGCGIERTWEVLESMLGERKAGERGEAFSGGQRGLCVEVGHGGALLCVVAEKARFLGGASCLASAATCRGSNQDGIESISHPAALSLADHGMLQALSP
jgi:hypothetical protein